MLLYIPTKAYSEEDCVKKHSSEIAEFGKKAMIVTGKHSSRANGSLGDVEEALKHEGIEYIVFNDIEENPSVETVMKAKEIGVNEQVDFVIGIGGGSPLDASKAIALMIANPNETKDVLYQAKKLSNLPIVCVPTTCGTGSEVTSYSILTLHEKRTKQSISHKIFPNMALIDAKYLKSMSREGIINTTVDALAHLIESYLNTNNNELNSVYSREGLRFWRMFKTNLLNNTITDADYKNMMHASMIAGMAISHTGTSLPHGLSYAITYEMGIPHGRAVGMFLGGFVEEYKDKMAVNDILELLDFENVDAFRQYMRALIGEIKVNADLMKMNATKILENKAKMKNYPFDIDENGLINMLED